jgi:hypothetical protein
MSGKSRSAVFSSRVTHHLNQMWDLRAAYTRFMGDPFLFPREFGCESVLTNITRFRMEGVSEAQAVTLQCEFHNDARHLKGYMAAAYRETESDFEVNRYGVPGHYYLASDVQYAFDGFFNGLTLEVLYVYKKSEDQTWTDATGKNLGLNYHHLNMIVNFNF